jgi:aryl-alcohol dehydrogenase-like predicted oxidoreductase
MEKRAFGSTGIRLSVIGFGGIAVMNTESAEAARIVAEAIDRGIDYFDVAPSYGNAQEKLGPALEPYRSKVFLACKTGKRTAAEAQQELDDSLRLMRTDHFDLYQLHGVTTMEDVETILGPGGALETFLKAREQGKIRFIGFSAHTEEAALALLDRFDFTSVLFPINWACWLKSGFGRKVIEKAEQKGVARLALKALAERRWAEGEEKKWPKCWYKPVGTYKEAALALRFTLGKSVTAAVMPSHADLLWWGCDAAQHLSPLSPSEEETLAQKARDLDAIFPQQKH